MSEIPAGSTIMVPQTLELALALQGGVALWGEIQETYTLTHFCNFLFFKLDNFEP